MRIVRAFHDGQESIHFQHYRVSLAFCGTGENVRRNLGFHRRSALRLGKRHRRKLLSLFRSAQAGKVPPSRSLLPPVNATLGLVILSPVISGQQLKSRPTGRVIASDLRCGAGPFRPVGHDRPSILFSRDVAKSSRSRMRRSWCALKFATRYRISSRSETGGLT